MHDSLAYDLKSVRLLVENEIALGRAFGLVRIDVRRGLSKERIELDRVQECVLTALRLNLNCEDEVYALGSQSYVALIRCDAESVAVVSQKILEAICVNAIGFASVGPTASVGVTTYPEGGTQADTLLRSLAESANRNAFLRPKIVDALDGAWERGECHLVYQPIVNAAREVEAYEALCRWESPTFGAVTPDVFISLAERYDFIGDLGRWVMRTAIEQVRRWNDECGRCVRVAVNVSLPQLDLAFVDFVVGELDRVGVDSRYLEIEVTESVDLNDYPAVISAIRQLRLCGIRVALDDFGTGNNFYERVSSFGIDTIKIDRKIIANILDAKGSAVVHSVMELAYRLKLSVVAEGVETPEQAQAVFAHGVHACQGWHYGRPSRAGIGCGMLMSVSAAL